VTIAFPWLPAGIAVPMMFVLAAIMPITWYGLGGVAAAR
jgi:hypothetical protein